MAPSTLLSLPKDILVMLPDYIHNIEDFTNFASTCRTLHDTMKTTSPKNVLRLAAAQDSIFFRPSPHFLVMATARELGSWARQSDTNEATFANHCRQGIIGLLNLALIHCGLTMQRVRELYGMRMSIINPVTDVIDQCVGKQWYSTPNFWNGSVSDAYTISSDPDSTFFHLAIYGELFAPDFEPFLHGTSSSSRFLSPETRSNFVRYCIPDWCLGGEADHQNNISLTWTIRSSRWRKHFKQFRTEVARCSEFKEEFDDGWWYVPDLGRDEEGGVDAHWRQRLWENLLICQGLEGLGMMRPQLQSGWVEKARRWKRQIASLEREPATVKIKKNSRQATLEYPFLLGDLRICAAGYVAGTD